MINIIGLSGLFISFLGMGLIIKKNIPLLLEVDPGDFRKKPSVIKKIKPYFQNFLEKITSFSVYDFLHKLLSKIKVMNLKTEKITDFWLGKIRQKSIENNKKTDKKDI